MIGSLAMFAIGWWSEMKLGKGRAGVEARFGLIGQGRMFMYLISNG
jgi:hypothetical protein